MLEFLWMMIIVWVLVWMIVFVGMISCEEEVFVICRCSSMLGMSLLFLLFILNWVWRVWVVVFIWGRIFCNLLLNVWCGFVCKVVVICCLWVRCKVWVFGIFVIVYIFLRFVI